MPFTSAQVALIDILADRLITTIMGIKKIRSMTEEDVLAEIEKYDNERAEEIKRLLNH
jgi:ERCC4-type nuclease